LAKCGSIEACLNCPNTDTCDKPPMDFEIEQAEARDKKAIRFEMYTRMDRREYFHCRWKLMDEQKKTQRRETSRKWQENNRERNKQKCRSYYREHAEEIKAKKREYYRKKKATMEMR